MIMPIARLVLLLLGIAVTTAAQAEIYIYSMPNGKRMIADHPMPPGDKGYRLIAKRDTLHNAGYILAGRRSPTDSVADFLDYIRATSARYKVDPDLVEAVIHVESGFDPNAVSKQGASGLMQLMWKTAQRYQIDDRFNPRENIDAGVRHLSYLMKRYKGKLPLVLAAWNAGAGAVDRYHGIPPFPETRRFVIKVLDYDNQLKQLYTSR